MSHAHSLLSKANACQPLHWIFPSKHTSFVNGATTQTLAWMTQHHTAVSFLPHEKPTISFTFFLPRSRCIFAALHRHCLLFSYATQGLAIGIPIELHKQKWQVWQQKTRDNMSFDLQSIFRSLRIRPHMKNIVATISLLAGGLI